MNIKLVGLLLAGSLLPSCGGGDSSSGGTPPLTGGGGGGTPSPPAISYTKFADLTGNQTFDSACSGVQLGSSQGASGATGFTQGLGFAYTASTDTWSITPAAGQFRNDVTLSFGPSDLVEEASTGTALYRRRNADGRTERFGYFTPPSLDPVPAYVRDVSVGAPLADGSAGISYCVFGVPTSLEDKIPDVVENSGFISYASDAVRGDVFVLTQDGQFEQYSLEKTVIDFRADPRDGSIKIRLYLNGQRYFDGGVLSDEVVSFGTVFGETSIDGSEQNYSGGSSTDQDDGGFIGFDFGGWFFGPQGAENGFVFDIMQNRNDGATVFGAGVVIGTGASEFVPV